MTRGCCGQPRRRRRRVEERIPENPKPPGGVDVIYLGAGHHQVVGSATGLVYHVSSQRRFFEAAPDDVDGILTDRDFILDE